MNCHKICALLFLAIFVSELMQLTHGQSLAPAPAAAPPMSNDGKAIEQGLAYVLMIAALLALLPAITELILLDYHIDKKKIFFKLDIFYLIVEIKIIFVLHLRTFKGPSLCQPPMEEFNTFSK
ncbi:hypothetical protein IEQ34_016096 [Dendrobium chrysotoxum]|uniref:Uncharacterized protein n=1 Tax=Dendrobium chrysotoxum TaxID=161865 RepID=A0AAV7GF48_DENCH|nr:hypothetical protein IEQ34_016096 [Dendrobium chrysotoxum]